MRQLHKRHGASGQSRCKVLLLPLLLGGALLSWTVARPALASDSPAVTAARNYAVTHGFTLKVVEAGPAQRRVQRVFVPVTPDSWNAFFKAFNAETGYCAIRHIKDSQGHNAINLKVSAEGAPQDCYLYGINYNSNRQTPQGHRLSDCRNMYMAPQQAGMIAVASLHGAPIQHLSQTLAQNDAAGVRINPPNRTNCMFWLPNAKVGGGDKDHLFGHLGITRSVDGKQMAAKLLHSANQRVEVVGVTVPQKEQFDPLTPEQLLGAAPACGVDGACAP